MSTIVTHTCQVAQSFLPLRCPYDGVAEPPHPEGARQTVMDNESAAWVASLASAGCEREDAVARLHAIALRVARAEAARRSGTNGLTGVELDDLAQQAADDAVVAILRRLDDFRGDSRFTTWACSFVIFELSGKIGRHVWRRRDVLLDEEGWSSLPDRLGERPESVAQTRLLLDAVRTAVREELTDHQRRVFEAVVVRAVPLDVLAASLATNRNAIYKTMFDARRKIRRFLVTHGHIEEATEVRR